MNDRGSPRRYRYVDFASPALPGFRNHIVRLEDVPALAARCAGSECYASIFCFSEDVLLYLAEHRVAGRPSIAGYDGRVWAPFFPLDIDSEAPEHGLDDALELARLTHRLLVERWDVAVEAVHAYFSGAKGFHLLVDTRAFGRVRPATDLHRIFARLRLEVLRALPDGAHRLFDLAIGDKVRLLRLPNTRHGRSRLYKVALTPTELLGASATEILRLARTPRPLPRVTAAGLLPVGSVAETPRLAEAFARARHAVGRARGPHPYRFGPIPDSPESALCAARLAMWRQHTPPGNRNNVAIRLASTFRLAGYEQPQTLALLLDWNRRREIDLPEDEIRGVVQSAYARPYAYAYGCHDEVIRGFCPFADRLHECEDYRAQHPRSERDGGAAPPIRRR